MTITDIVRDREKLAEISHCISGVLYYNVEVDGKKYQFTVDMNNTDDVGTTTFNAKEKAITMMRYIRKSLDSGSFTEVY